MSSHFQPSDIRQHLSFAKRRLHDLLTLNGGNLPGADGAMRLQLIQEFFFHLISATEVLAQLVNDVRSLGIDTEKVAVWKVANALPNTDPVKTPLSSLYVQTRNCALPYAPYSDEGYIFRVLVYRHFATHSGRAPLLFRKCSSPSASLFIDPRAPKRTPATRSVQDELRHAMDLIQSRVQYILTLL